jgi:hypothetical protein
MTGLYKLNPAVPSLSLLDRSNLSRLGFETTSWKHLNRYVGHVEHLPTVFDGPTASAAALLKVRSVVNDFGSPQQLRRLLHVRPLALLANQPPQTPYATAAWVLAHLGCSASSVVATLKTLSSAGSAPEAKMALRQLGGDAEFARKAIGPMVRALRCSKIALLNANDVLVTAYTEDANTLRQVQEDVGRLAARIDILTNEVARRRFFDVRKKRDLEQELTALRPRKSLTSRRSDELRAALALMESIHNEGFWLERGFDDLIGFFDRLRHELTIFGSAVTQIAADGLGTWLRDAAHMRSMLGMNAAIEQWDAIDKAARSFLVRSTIDFQLIDSAKTGQP